MSPEITSSTQSLTPRVSRPKSQARNLTPNVEARSLNPNASRKRCADRRGLLMSTDARRRPCQAPELRKNPSEPAKQSVRLLPSGFGHHELRGSAIRRPYDFEVAADPLAHSAGELDLRPLEAHRTENRRVLVGGDVLANRLAVHADLLDRRLEDLQARPAVGAGPAVRLLLEALHVG